MCMNPPVPCDCDSEDARTAHAAIRAVVAPATFSYAYDPGPSGPWWAEALGHRVEQQPSASAALAALRALIN